MYLIYDPAFIVHNSSVHVLAKKTFVFLISLLHFFYNFSFLIIYIYI